MLVCMRPGDNTSFHYRMREAHRYVGLSFLFFRSDLFSENRKTVSLDANRPLPCCKDESGGSICRAMKANDLKEFSKK